MSIFFYSLSFILTLLSVFWNSFLGFWFCFEVGSILLVNGFFSNTLIVNRYLGLLNFLLLSGVSSVLLFVGLSFNSFYYFIIFSLLIKVGVFPLSTWLFNVYINSSWVLIYFIGVLSKIPFIYVCFMELSDLNNFILLLLVVTLFCCSIGIWSEVSNIKIFVLFSSIASSSVLLVMCCSTGLIEASVFLCVYMLTSFISFLVFWYSEVNLLFFSSSLLWIFILMGLPFSFNIIYKFIASYFLVNFFSSWFLVSWCVYSILEQLYLFLYLLNKVSFNVYY